MKADPKSDRASVAGEVSQEQAERLSAWLDGELDARAAESLVRELVSGQALQRKFASWCVVGDAMRSQEVAAEHSPRLCASVSRALQDEPALLAPRALSSRVRHQLASGIAVAAAMAVLVLVAVPLLRGTGTSAGGAADKTIARSTAPAELAGHEASGVAAASSGEAPTARQPRLDPYFEAHRDFTAEGVMPAAAIYLRSGNESDR